MALKRDGIAGRYRCITIRRPRSWRIKRWGPVCKWPYVTRDHRSFNRSFHSVHTTSIHWTMWIRSTPALPLPKGSGVLMSGSESFWGYLPPLDHKLPEGRVFDPACRESFPKMITPPSPPAAGAAGARKALRSPTKLTFRVRSPGWLNPSATRRRVGTGRWRLVPIGSHGRVPCLIEP